MTKNDWDKIISEAKKVALSKEESEVILARVSEYVRQNPIRSEIVSPYQGAVMPEQAGRPIWYGDTQSMSARLLKIKKYKLMPILLILALMLGGGTSFAAQNALPGDALYPVKVRVNEKLESMTAWGADANLRLETRLAGERLLEAEKLSQKGELNAQVKNELKAEFAAHASKAEKMLSEIKANAGAEAGLEEESNFESSLAVHHLVLGTLSKSDAEDKDTLADLANAVNARLAARAEASANGKAQHSSNKKKLDLSVASDLSAETSLEIEARARGVLKAAQNKIEGVEKFINAQAEANAEAKAEAEAKLTLAKNKMADAKVKIEAGAYAAAFAELKAAMKLAQEAKLTLLAQGELKINFGAPGDQGNQNTNGNESGESHSSAGNSLNVNAGGDANANTNVNAGSTASGVLNTLGF